MRDELEDIRRYDKVKSKNEERISFEQYLKMRRAKNK